MPTTSHRCQVGHRRASLHACHHVFAMSQRWHVMEQAYLFTCLPCPVLPFGRMSTLVHMYTSVCPRTWQRMRACLHACHVLSLLCSGTDLLICICYVTAMPHGHRDICVWISAISNHMVGTRLFTYIPYPSGDMWWHVCNCLHNCQIHSHHVVAQNMFGNLKRSQC